MIVTNLNTTVSRDDIIELFGDIGALKSAKIATVGTAEVVFVNREDAQKATDIYHNRMLDKKIMRCQFVESVRSNPNPIDDKMSQKSLRRDRGRYGGSRSRVKVQIDVDTVHLALFGTWPSPRRSTQGRPIKW